MKRTYLGEFEEIVLLTVAILDGQAYGITLLHAITEQTGRTVRLNQIHSALYRLEEKGMVSTYMGGATNERGGRRKRMVSITALGQRALQEIQEVREQLWSLIPKPVQPAIAL